MLERLQLLPLYPLVELADGGEKKGPAFICVF